MVDMETVGAKIRLARKRAKLTQYEVTRRAGIGNSALAQLEQGKRPHIAFHVVANVAQVLGVSLDSLICANSRNSTRNKKGEG